MLHAEYQATTNKRGCCERSQAVAKECGDKYAIVTYGLAAAKVARQIQIQNSSKLFHKVRSIPHNFIIIFINR